MIVLREFLGVFFLHHTLKQPLASLLHLNQPGLESLPQLVVLGASYIARMPDVMLDELFNLVVPLRLYHAFFN
jgi:hypothetical protein